MPKTPSNTKKLSIFDWLKEITYNKSPWNSFNEEDKESFNPYMIHRFLSMNPDYIEFVNTVQTIPYTNKERIYNVYLYTLPKKDIWLKYIKSTTPKKQDALLKHIASYYECSLSDAEEYINLGLLSDKGMSYILQNLGVDDKEIKKLLK